jgi:hypothetical protein
LLRAFRERGLHQHLVAEILDDGVEHGLVLLLLDTAKKRPPVRYSLNACSRDTRKAEMAGPPVHAAYPDKVS